MSLTSKMRAPFLIGFAAMALIGACGDENDSGSKDAATGSVDASSSTDSSTRPDTLDAGADARAVSDEDADTESDASNVQLDAASDDATAPVGDGGAALVPLPADGNRLSVCYDKTDCKGDDLTCYAPDTKTPGFCTDDCVIDSDCQPLGGIATTCSQDEQKCRTDCVGTGMGDGACPANMACRNIALTVFSPAAYRCTYREGSGSMISAAYQRCDSAHGDADCQTGLTCFVPDALSSGSTTIGYCSPACSEAKACPAAGGATAAASCVGGGCALDCSASGSTCPTGTSCRQALDSTLQETYRCKFIE